MALNKLIVPPDQSSYAFEDGVEVLAVKLDGGASRYRKDIEGSTATVNVKWTVGTTNYQYLRAFYRAVGKQALPFLIDLYLEEPVLIEHEAYFIPGSMRLVSQRGLAFVVSAKLEVKPNENDLDYDQSLIDLIQEYGSADETQAVLNQLEQLTNFDFPEI